MRHLALIVAVVAACLSALPAAAQTATDAAPPASMTLVWKYWGDPVNEWMIPRGGEGRHVDREGHAVVFPVSVEQFDRFRTLFAPYEGVTFRCRRLIPDGPYGSVIWSRPGEVDQTLNFDAGCTGGDAADIFRRIEEAETMLDGFKAGR